MSAVDDLAAFIEASPTPWHAARNAARRLTEAGFAEVRPGDHFGADAAGKAVVVRGGSLVAWTGRPGSGTGPIRLIGAHTDSPGLRIRPRPDAGTAGFRTLGIEVYGGALWNSWLDRDLTLAGRVSLAEDSAPEHRGPGGISTVLFHHDGPLLRVPQLAIHLDRGVNESLSLDPQRDLDPVWGLGEPGPDGFRSWLAGQVGRQAGEILAWDVACVDAAPPARLGAEGELLAAARLDDLCCCFGAIEALVAHTGSQASGTPAVVVLYDHEEVGSITATGAMGAWAAQVLERVAVAGGGDRTTLMEALAGSLLLSADMAHCTHPNRPERHEPHHWIAPGGGPVIKHNVNARYATDSVGAAAFRRACDAAGVAVQDYAHRNDMACGTTIGPLAAAGLAIDTVDVGMPQLSMHSARELMAVADVDPMVASFTAWLADAR